MAYGLILHSLSQILTSMQLSLPYNKTTEPMLSYAVSIYYTV